jgi:hypothetical protein
MEFGPQQVGKWLILMGITIVLAGWIFSACLSVSSCSSYLL